MGSCTGQGNHPLPQKSKNLQNIKFRPLELTLIEQMYQNLAKRCRNNIVTRQTFDLFFHSSGLIGQILFLKFDKSKDGTISFQQFLASFELMIKGSLRDRADILFQIYDVDHTGGVKFNELLKILFSYSVEDLNKMFVEQNFLKHISSNQLSLHYYFGAEHKIVQEKNIISQQSEDQDDNSTKHKTSIPSSVVLSRVVTDLDKSQKTIQIQKQNREKGHKTEMKNGKLAPLLRPQKPCRKATSTTQISINSKIKRKSLKIKSNIASLTKQYARYLFVCSNLSKDKDVFSREHFFKLIQEHPSLFNVYLTGFHTYIWQVDENDEPEYFKAMSWVESDAEQRFRGEKNSVYLKFIQKTIFVMPTKRKKIPKDIISLQGLTFDTIQKQVHEKYHYGIVFRHRDGIYPAKQYYFKSKEIYDEWTKQLVDFKSTSIYDLYNKHERIGGGNFSSVFKGIDKKSQLPVAIKVIQTFKLSVAEKQVLKRQTGILKQCHHPNIIKFLGQFKTKTHIYIVTQIMMEGDLFQYTKKNSFLQQYQAAIILKQLIDSILYLNEELGIIHRDLKPENVMIKMNEEKKMVLRVKLIDFGFGVFKDKVKQLPPKQKFAGTPGFIAPQIYRAEEYDEKIDTFSLGIILYFMLSGQFPFHSQFLEQIQDLTKSCTISLVSNHWSNISQEAKNLLNKVLCFKQERISTKQMAEHPWLKNIDNLKELNGRNTRKSKGFFQ